MTEHLSSPAVRLLVRRVCLVVGGAMWWLLSMGAPSHGDDGTLPIDPGGEGAVLSVPAVTTLPPVTPTTPPAPVLPDVQPVVQKVAEPVEKIVAEPVTSGAQSVVQQAAEPIQEVAASVVHPVREIVAPTVGTAKEAVRSVEQGGRQALDSVGELAPTVQPVKQVVATVVEATQIWDQALPAPGTDAPQSVLDAVDTPGAASYPAGGRPAGAAWGADTSADSAGEARPARQARPTGAPYAAAGAAVAASVSRPAQVGGRGDAKVSPNPDRWMPVWAEDGDGHTTGVDRPSPSGGAVLTSPISISRVAAASSLVAAPTDRIPAGRTEEPDHTPD